MTLTPATRPFVSVAPVVTAAGLHVLRRYIIVIIGTLLFCGGYGARGDRRQKNRRGPPERSAACARGSVLPMV